MTLFPWHPPYDGEWILGFLGARAVRESKPLAKGATPAASPWRGTAG